MSKYAALNLRLVNSPDQAYRLKSSQIEIILKRKLPESARRYPEWWANERGDSRHTQCKS